MGSLIDEFIAWMRVRNTAENTQHNRPACLESTRPAPGQECF
jgi:hypothetical protein